MATAQVVLGVALLSTGIVMIAGRRSIAARAQRRRASPPAPPILWLFLGTVSAMNGVVQLLLALA